MRRRLTSFNVLACAALVLCAAPVTAQDVSVPALKAAFLTNFVKFAEWPANTVPAGRLFTFCVRGDKAVSAALHQHLKDAQGPEAVRILLVTADDSLASCQMLYLAGMDLRQVRQVIEALKGAAVFTVSDVAGFAEAGGVAQFRLEKGQMKFAINPASAQRARLALSAKLLSLAIIVKDDQDETR
jgi:hypothetical protein